jgi:hypothetical protein
VGNLAGRTNENYSIQPLISTGAAQFVLT